MLVDLNLDETGMLLEQLKLKIYEVSSSLYSEDDEYTESNLLNELEKLLARFKMIRQLGCN